MFRSHLGRRLGLTLILLVMSQNAAVAQLACGLKPLTPLGCRGQPQCICTDNGCQWVWTNCR